MPDLIKEESSSNAKALNAGSAMNLASSETLFSGSAILGGSSPERLLSSQGEVLSWAAFMPRVSRVEKLGIQYL